MSVRPPQRKRFQAGRVAIVGAMTLITSTASAHYSLAQSPADTIETVYFPHSQFKIPFNVDARGTQPTQVQLWFRPTAGASWQIAWRGQLESETFLNFGPPLRVCIFLGPDARREWQGVSKSQPPMRILIDTTKPQIALRPDVNASGQVVVDIRISEEHLVTDSVKLRYRTDREVEWNEVQVDNLVAAGEIYEGQVTLDIDQCREVGFVATVADAASNIGEASAQYVMPRTAAMQDIKLASQRNDNGDSKVQRLQYPARLTGRCHRLLRMGAPHGCSPDSRDESARCFNATTVADATVGFTECDNSPASCCAIERDKHA